MIIGALCTNFIDTPREAAEKELSKIADNYYITYMYPRLLGSLDNDPTENAFQIQRHWCFRNLPAPAFKV